LPTAVPNIFPFSSTSATANRPNVKDKVEKKNLIAEYTREMEELHEIDFPHEQQEYANEDQLMHQIDQFTEPVQPIHKAIQVDIRKPYRSKAI